MKREIVFKYTRVISQLIFWMLSANIWFVIFNPTLGDRFGLFGFGIIVFFITTLFFIFSILPLIWFVNKYGLVFKISVTTIFLALFIAMVVIQIKSGSLKENITFIPEAYFKYYLYVVVFHLFIVTAVYFNLNVLVIRYLNKTKYWSYFMWLTVLIVASSFANNFLFDYVIDPVFPSLFYISFLKVWETLIVNTCYVVFTTLVYLIWQYGIFLMVNREKSQNELLALKSQINPHFLFNNLNTIYSLASENDSRTKDVILKLSDYLRYVLYDTVSDKIPLEKEIETIRTYVSLQEERLNQDKTKVEINTKGNTEGVSIAPLMLLPLAENCFKHGIRKEGGIIKIDIEYAAKTLIFKSVNPVAVQSEKTAEKNGIGIRNVERRLNLLYPNHHEFTFRKTDDIFSVFLSIKLK